MKLLLTLTLFAAALSAQTNSNCPNATGATPHCVVVAWGPPASGPAPSGYNVYTGGTKPGQCTTVTAATCTKVGSASALTLTHNSTAAQVLTEGATYFYVVTSTNGTSESVPSVEVSAAIPFLVPNSPAGASATGH